MCVYACICMLVHVCICMYMPTCMCVECHDIIIIRHLRGEQTCTFRNVVTFKQVY